VPGGAGLTCSFRGSLRGAPAWCGEGTTVATLHGSAWQRVPSGWGLSQRAGQGLGRGGRHLVGGLPACASARANPQHLGLPTSFGAAGWQMAWGGGAASQTSCARGGWPYHPAEISANPGLAPCFRGMSEDVTRPR
jgi:hypothetical protein